MAIVVIDRPGAAPEWLNDVPLDVETVEVVVPHPAGAAGLLELWRIKDTVDDEDYRVSLVGYVSGQQGARAVVRERGPGVYHLCTEGGEQVKPTLVLSEGSLEMRQENVEADYCLSPMLLDIDSAN